MVGVEPFQVDSWKKPAMSASLNSLSRAKDLMGAVKPLSSCVTVSNSHLSEP